MRAARFASWSLAATVVAAWMVSAQPRGSPTLVWERPVEVDQGPWRMNASRFLYVDDLTVALDAGGSAAWPSRLAG